MVSPEKEDRRRRRHGAVDTRLPRKRWRRLRPAEALPVLLVSSVALLAVLSGDGDGSRAAAEKCGGGGAFRASGGQRRRARMRGMAYNARTSRGTAGSRGGAIFGGGGADVDGACVIAGVSAGGARVSAEQGEGEGAWAGPLRPAGLGPFLFSFFFCSVLFPSLSHFKHL